MKRLCVIGMGYVGLTTATCFADLGNQVIGLDIDGQRIADLEAGRLPIYEPGLEELVKRNAQAGRLRFTTSYAEALAVSDFAFIAVNTPSGTEGEANMRYVRAAAEEIGRTADHPVVVINKSTVPIGTGDLVTLILEKVNPDVARAVVSNPEFLREGSAIQDFMHPDRVVLGSVDQAVAREVATLYEPLNCPVIVTDLRTAEMIKYASNAFLATRVSFINEIAAICDQTGADVIQVARGMGYDKRIGPAYLDAGLGFGGSCFPKDVRALAHMAAIHGCHPQLLRAVLEINRDQRRALVQRVRDLLGPLEGVPIGVLGLSFKPNTDDLRESASIEVIHLLQHEGAQIRAFDPVAMRAAAEILNDVVLCPTAYDAAAGTDALIVATEWNEFKQLDLDRVRAAMRTPVVVDGRNLYDPATMRAKGFVYVGIGRGLAREPAVGTAVRRASAEPTANGKVG